MVGLLILSLVGAPAVAEIEVGSDRTLLDIAVLLRLSSSFGEPQTTLVSSTNPADVRLLQFDTAALLQPRSTQQLYPSAVAFFGVEHEARQWLTLRLYGDTGELRSGSSLDPPTTNKLTINGYSVATGLFSLERVRELAAMFTWQYVCVDMGKRYTQVGNSLIFEDFATGAAVTADLEAVGLRDWQLQATAVLVGQTVEELEVPSPLAVLRLEYGLSMFESIGVFGAYYGERNGRLHDVLASVVSEAHIGTTAEQIELNNIWVKNSYDSTGGVGFVGVDAHFLPAEGLSIRAAGVFSFGAVELGITDDRALTFDLRSWAANTEATYGLNTNFGVGVFALALSGDEPPAADKNHVDYNGFIGIAPYWTWTGMFFSGGLSQGMFPGRATAAGVNGHGVTGGGGRVEYSTDHGFVELRMAGLWATSAPALFGGEGRFYGLETDLVAEWDLLDWLGLGAEIDVFWPGTFFPSRDAALRAIGQLHAHLGD